MPRNSDYVGDTRGRRRREAPRRKVPQRIYRHCSGALWAPEFDGHRPPLQW